MTQHVCCGFDRCSLISFGGLRFCSSLWPPTTSSSCWTRLPQVWSSFRWSQGMSGGPSTAPSSLPDIRKEDWEKKRLERDRRREREAQWQTLINTSRWLHFMWVQTCFDCYCILPTNIARDIYTAVAILWMKSQQECRNPSAFPSVSVSLRHNNCCCYPISLVKTLIVYSYCEKCVFLSLLMDSGHFCFTSTIQNKTTRSGLEWSCIWLLTNKSGLERIWNNSEMCS